MCHVRVEIFLGFVPAMKDVCEAQGGYETLDRTGGEVKRLVDGAEVLEVVGHGFNLVGVDIVFDLENDDVLDDLRHDSV